MVLGVLCVPINKWQKYLKSIAARVSLLMWLKYNYCCYGFESCCLIITNGINDMFYLFWPSSARWRFSALHHRQNQNQYVHMLFTFIKCIKVFNPFSMTSLSSLSRSIGCCYSNEWNKRKWIIINIKY